MDPVIASTQVGDPLINQPVEPIVQEPQVNESPEQRYQRLYGQPPPQTSTLPPEVLSTLQAMTAEIASLKQGMQVPVSAVTPSKLEWVEKIRSGDFEGAQASLAQSVQASLAPRLEEVRQQAYNDALSASQVTNEVNLYLQQIRSANPDIIQFERYLNGPVTERIQLAQQAGRIKAPTDFLREYKAAVDDEVKNLRNLGLQFRAAGKDDALTRQVDVRSSTPITPQQVQSNQQAQTASQNNPQGESSDDYFTRRRADEARRRGLA